MSQTRGPQQQGLERRPASGTVSRISREDDGLTRRSDNQRTTNLTTFDAAEAAQWIDEASIKSGGKVVTPSMMPVFPHGRGVAVSVIRITDFNPQGTQLYPIQGSSNLGLHKNVLDEIGRGFAIDWPKEWQRKVPFTLPGAKNTDPRDLNPWCIQYEVCGRYKKFDGTWTTLPALTKEIDLRETYIDPVTGEERVPAEVEQIRTRHLEKQTKDLPRDATQVAIDERYRIAKRNADAELAQLRKFIRAHAQTKARLMVIGTLVRRSYSKQELETPFYVFSSVWTGRSTNPEIDLMLAKGALDMEKEGRALLYGGTGVTEPAQLPAAVGEPYQDDAELVAYEKAVAAAEGSGGDVGQPQDEPKQCSPDGCLGAGSKHVKACPADADQQVCTVDKCFGKGAKHQEACYGTETSGAAAQQQPTEEAKPKDPVYDALSRRADQLISELERPDLSDDEVARIKGEQKTVDEAIAAHQAAQKK